MKTANQTENLSRAGQNLIRVIIASYFIGVSLGLISGTDATPLAAMFLEPETATLVGSATIFIFGYLVMTGIWLRFAAMMLALIMFWSSYMANIVGTSATGVGAFWLDMTLIGALMLTYVRTNDRDSAGTAMIRRKSKVRRLGAHSIITPRRVAALGSTNVTRLPTVESRQVNKEEIQNIFAEESKKRLAAL